jgi:hypothetical protein
MYHVVVSVNRPVKVSLKRSATECDAFMPTISKMMPTTNKTAPRIR